VPDQERDGFRKTVLPSGLTVIGEHVDSVRSVSIGVWVRVGARDEHPAESGMSHFLEHMVFKGTEARDAYQLALSLESVGGHLDAFTGREVTCFDARALDEHLDLAVEVLADLVLHPRLDPADVEKEKKVVLDEIHTYEDTPDERIHDLFADVVWAGHPLGNRILGTRQSVETFTREAIARYHGRRYGASNLLLAIAGRFDWDRFLAEVALRFGNAAPGVRPDGHGVETNGRDVVHHVKDLAQQYLVIGARGLPSGHPDRHALVVLSTLLGGGMSSRLFQEIRERRRKAYTVYSFLSSYCDAGYTGFYVGTSPEWVREVVEVIRAELERVTRDGLAPAELVRVKNQMKGNMLLGLETSDSRMSRLAKNAIYFGRDVTLDEVAVGIDGVTNADVVRICQRLFRPRSLALTVLGDLKGEALADEVLRG